MILQLFAPTPANAAARQVADLNQSRDPGGRAFSYRTADFEPLGEPPDGRMYFSADDGIHGNELWESDGTPGGTRMVEDLCPGACSSEPTDLTAVGDRLFFVADDGSHGQELWVSQPGTPSPRMVADLTEGLLGSVLETVTAFGDEAFFFRFSGGAWRLWRSDGTEAGTTTVFEFPPGGSLPQGWVTIGDTFFFAGPDEDFGNEPWASDGTKAGTQMIKDLLPGPVGSIYNAELIPGLLPFLVYNGHLIFRTRNLANGTAVWSSDGTAEGTVLLVDPDQDTLGTASAFFVACRDLIFFHGGSTEAGLPLWSTDGTPEGTLSKTQTSSIFGELACQGDRVLFIGETAESGRELWKTDGTDAGTEIVIDLNPGPSGALGLLEIFGQAGGKTFFHAFDAQRGYEPWISDGTAAGTTLLADIAAGPRSSNIPSGQNFYSDLVSYDHPDTLGDRWFFRAYDAIGREEIWVTDGTSAGTIPLHIDQQSSGIRLNNSRTETTALFSPAIASFGGHIFVAADDGVHGSELWKIGPEGERELFDIEPGPYGAMPGPLFSAPFGLLFGAYKEMIPPPRFLWLSDGTMAGSAATEHSFDEFGQPFPAVSFDDSLFVPAMAGFVWSDGTEAGTSFGEPARLTAGIAAIPEGVFYGDDSFSAAGGLRLFDGVSSLDLPAGGDIRDLVANDNRAFFTAHTAEHGREPWTSDGTAAGTFRLADLAPGSLDGTPFFNAIDRCRRSAVAGGRFFFVGGPEATGSELWISDGTVAGTQAVKDVKPGSRSSDICELVGAGEQAFFVADDGVHGRELWISDGTTEGTRMVGDMSLGPASSLPQEPLAVGDLLYFSAHTPAFGRELWVADGTATGTRRLTDIAPGPISASPMDLLLDGSDLYFAATDGVTGFELWTYSLTEIFTDGFESGDLTAWSSATP